MKALILEEIKKPLALRECPSLEPKQGQVVVQLNAAALNRRDYWITQGLYPGIKMPVTLGSDGAGVVRQVGDGVDASWKGREVMIYPGLDWGNSEKVQSKGFHVLGMPTDGTFASEVAVLASQIYTRPVHLNWHEAAALPLAGLTAYRALFIQGEMRSGETVLISGVGGGVATFALQFAVKAGAKVWVTSSSPRKIQQAVELGAQGGFDYTTESWTKEFVKLAGAPDLIIDSGAGKGYRNLVNIASPGARIVNYGGTAGPPEKLDIFKLFWKQLRLIGSSLGSPKDFEGLLEFVGKHKIKPVIDAVFPLADGNRAVEQMKSSPQFGKYVLEIDA